MNALEAMRLDRRWTRQELAERSNVSDETIRRLESLGGAPRMATAAKLADALDLTPSEFVARLRDEWLGDSGADMQPAGGLV